MGWLIGRTAAMSDPEGARRKALEKLRGIAEMEDPESAVVPILTGTPSAPAPNRDDAFTQHYLSVTFGRRLRPDIRCFVQVPWGALAARRAPLLLSHGRAVGAGEG